jgi:hypothetical protein
VSSDTIAIQQRIDYARQAVTLLSRSATNTTGAAPLG